MKKKILIIDDEPAYLEIIKDEFEEADKEFKVITAMDGEEARKKAKEYIPDLIILDIILPPRKGEVLDRTEGMKILDDLKGNSETKNIKIIILTVIANYISIKMKAEEMKIPFFRKPFDTKELVNTARELFKEE
ncbi:MAG: response regulator [bacterium]